MLSFSMLWAGIRTSLLLVLDTAKMAYLIVNNLNHRLLRQMFELNNTSNLQSKVA